MKPFDSNADIFACEDNMLFCTSEDIKFSRESSLGISLVFSYIIKISILYIEKDIGMENKLHSTISASQHMHPLKQIVKLEFECHAIIHGTFYNICTCQLT